MSNHQAALTPSNRSYQFQSFHSNRIGPPNPSILAWTVTDLAVSQDDMGWTHGRARGQDWSLDHRWKTERLPDVAAYRIAMEALTNVVRHARAAKCNVRISDGEGDILELGITDDGVGIPADCQAGVGITSMRERAEELGATCVIEPLAEGGTHVLARLPLRNQLPSSDQGKSLP